MGAAMSRLGTGLILDLVRPAGVLRSNPERAVEGCCLDLALAVELDEFADNGIDSVQVLRDARVIRPEALEAVIQMREVDEA